MWVKVQYEIENLTRVGRTKICTNQNFPLYGMVCSCARIQHKVHCQVYSVHNSTVYIAYESIQKRKAIFILYSQGGCTTYDIIHVRHQPESRYIHVHVNHDIVLTALGVMYLLFS